MAIKPRCDVADCRKELKKQGAIIMGPLNRWFKSRKYHVCAACSRRVLAAVKLIALCNGTMIDLSQTARVYGVPDRKNFAANYFISVNDFQSIKHEFFA